MSMPAVAIPESDIYEIPLSHLIRSDTNVRKNKDTAESISGLADSIMEVGLINPLTVIEQVDPKTKKATGLYEVTAGGRRLLAFQKLAKQKRIPADYIVRCGVVSRAAATQISLVENTERQDMHPADEFAAFVKLIEEEGFSIEAVAAKFRVSPNVVERRLRLARVAPELVTLFRANEIDLAQMMALAVTDDHDRQLKAWKTASKYERAPERLRSKLTAGELHSSNPLVAYVGLDAYRAAGGVTRADLFANEGGELVGDAVLVRELATNKLKTQAQKQVGKKPCAWIDADLDYNEYRHTHYAVDGVPEPFTEAQQTKRAPLLAELATVQARWLELECGDDDELPEEVREANDAEFAAVSKRKVSLEKKLEAITTPVSIPTEVMPFVGALVTLSNRGTASVRYPVARDADIKQVRALLAKAKRAASPTPADDTPTLCADDAPRSHSDAQTKTLTEVKTLALRAAFATQSQASLRVLAHSMLIGVLMDGYDHVAIASRTASETVSDDATALAPAATKRLNDLRSAWLVRVTGNSDAGRMVDERRKSVATWCMTVELAEIIDAIGYCTAVSINATVDREGATHSRNGKRIATLTPYAALIGFDCCQWFAPTAGAYFGSVSKRTMAAGLADAGIDASEIDAVLKLKKSDAAARAAQLVDGKGWVPELMRV